MPSFETKRSYSGVGEGGELTTAQEANVASISTLSTSSAGQFLRKTSTTAYENALAVVLSTGTS